MENCINHQTSTDDTLIVIQETLDEGLEASSSFEKTMNSKLRRESPMSATSCIFRVPHVLRRHNPDSYEPHLVSIGPFHRGRQQYQPIENVKQWYLHNFLSHMNISLKTLIQGIIKYEKSARDFYAEPLDHLSQQYDFIEMMILDGCFLIQLFRNFLYKKLRTTDDPIFSMDCMLKYLFRDLLLLENQIPWFVLNYLYLLTVDKYPDEPSLSFLILTVFSSQSQLSQSCRSYLAYLCDHDQDGDDDGGKYLHILHLVRSSISLPFKDHFDQSFYDPKIQLIHPATALSRSRIEFIKSSDDGACIMNIEFKDEVFTIPQLEIGQLTESLFRNLIAFEQCFHGCSHKITSYVALMDNLISSSNDVEFLCQKEIILNRLTGEDASQFFGKLYNDTLLSKFYYSGLCTEVNNCYTVKRNMLLRDMRLEFSTKEKLMSDYLSSPWKVMSFIAAFILLLLTMLQTGYTILQYYSPQN